MISSSSRIGKAAAGRSSVAAAAPKSNRKVACKASTAWDSWSSYMGRRAPVQKPKPEELKHFSAIGGAIKSSAETYKPNFGAATQSTDRSYKQVHVEKVVPRLSADLHQTLEAVGIVQLKSVLGLSDSAPFDAATTSFTTTDVNAGICITGCITQKGGDKNAYVALTATETERQASWSRLEGLLLHWACTSSPGGHWTMPPQGWAATPSKVTDAGGAMQCAFERQTLPGGQQVVYTVVLKLPLSGILRSGGITFVLKASDAQNTKWLKDAVTDRDFFVDLQDLPFVAI